MKTTTSKNIYQILLKRVSVVGLLVYSMILSIQSASAATFLLTYECALPRPCPLASAIYIDLSLDKINYAPNEPVTMVGSVDSDDNPQPPGRVSPIGKGTAGIFPPSIDIFPGTYTVFDIQNGFVFGSVVLGNAPVAPGSYNAPVFGGAGGYVYNTQDVHFTVIGPQGVWCLTNETGMPNAMCTEPSRFGVAGVPLPFSCTIGDVQYRCEVDTGSTKLRDEYTCKASCAPASVNIFFSN